MAAIVSGMSKVSFSTKIGMLMKSTSDDANPTPAFLFGEIAKITFESLDYCDYLADFLNDRLKKKSLQIKSKVLIVIRNTLEKGSPEFAKCLRRKSEGIRDCKDINGPPDPLHGDKFYVDVRTNAERVLNILFDLERNNTQSETTGQQQQSFNSGLQGKIQGFGSNASSSSSQQNEGGIMKDIYDNVKGALEGIMKPTSPQPKDASYMNANEQKSQVSRPSNTHWGHSSCSAPESAFQGNASFNQQSTMSTSLVPSGSSTYNWLDKGNLTTNSNESFNNNTNKNKAKHVDMHETEKRVIEEITAIQGIRPQPAKADIDAIIKRCHNLNCEIIVQELNTKLQEQDSRVQLRAMCVIESMLCSSLPSIRHLIDVNCKTTLSKLKDVSHSTTRNKAQKILEILYPQPISTTKQNQMQASQQDGNLLGNNNNADLFGGMAMEAPTTTTTTTVNKQSDPFGDLNFNIAAPPPPSSVVAPNSKISTTKDVGFDPFSNLTNIPQTTSSSSDLLSSATISAIPKPPANTNNSSLFTDFNQAPSSTPLATSSTDGKFDPFESMKSSTVLPATKPAPGNLLNNRNSDLFGDFNSNNSASTIAMSQQSSPGMLPQSSSGFAGFQSSVPQLSVAQKSTSSSQNTKHSAPQTSSFADFQSNNMSNSSIGRQANSQPNPPSLQSSSFADFQTGNMSSATGQQNTDNSQYPNLTSPKSNSFANFQSSSMSKSNIIPPNSSSSGTMQQSSSFADFQSSSLSNSSNSGTMQQSSSFADFQSNSTSVPMPVFNNQMTTLSNSTTTNIQVSQPLPPRQQQQNISSVLLPNSNSSSAFADFSLTPVAASVSGGAKPTSNLDAMMNNFSMSASPRPATQYTRNIQPRHQQPYPTNLVNPAGFPVNNGPRMMNFKIGVRPGFQGSPMMAQQNFPQQQQFHQGSMQQQQQQQQFHQGSMQQQQQQQQFHQGSMQQQQGNFNMQYQNYGQNQQQVQQQQHQANSNLNFISKPVGGGGGQARNSDAFSFVQDAMKANKK